MPSNASISQPPVPLFSEHEACSLGGLHICLTPDTSLHQQPKAVCPAQGNEGLALGCLFAKAGYSTFKYLCLAAAFILVTPLGVAIGIGGVLSLCTQQPVCSASMQQHLRGHCTACVLSPIDQGSYMRWVC